MTIVKLSRYQRPIIFSLMPFLCVLLVWTPAFARKNGTNEDPKSSNVKWTTKNDVIIINYDLTGSPDDKYIVSVLMKKENDETLIIQPLTMEGDVGEGFFSGNNKEIRWYYRRDYPQGFPGKGYYFEIQVKEISQSNPLLYYIAGGVAVVGGLVALLASKNQTNEPPPAGDLPFPPVRP
jgi:hypothetical protein